MSKVQTPSGRFDNLCAASLAAIQRIVARAPDRAALAEIKSQASHWDNTLNAKEYSQCGRAAQAVYAECKRIEGLFELSERLTAVPTHFEADSATAANAEVHWKAELHKAEQLVAEAAGEHDRVAQQIEQLRREPQIAHEQACARVRELEDQQQAAIASGNIDAAKSVTTELHQARAERQQTSDALVSGVAAELAAAMQPLLDDCKADLDDAREVEKKAREGLAAAKVRAMQIESPRVSRRLQLLRRWSHEQVEQVFARAA